VLPILDPLKTGREYDRHCAALDNRGFSIGPECFSWFEPRGGEQTRGDVAREWTIVLDHDENRQFATARAAGRSVEYDPASGSKHDGNDEA
jgi:hypothetical protein